MNAIQPIAATELQNLLNYIGMTHGRLLAVLRAARRIEDSSEDSINDLNYLIEAAVDYAGSAAEQSQLAETVATEVRQRLEFKPEPGDRISADVLLQMFQFAARRGEGTSAYHLSTLASTLGSYAKRDSSLQPLFDFWIGWMAGLGIKTATDKSVEEVLGRFSVMIVDAPGGADAIIRAAAG